MGKYIKRVVLLIVITIFLYSGFQLAQYYYDGYASSKLNDRMKQQYKAAQKVQQGQNATDQGELTDEQMEQQYRERFEQLRDINSDIVGWINIENTGVDYPVVQSSNNEYYLSHNVEHQSSARGSIFMDYRNNNINDNIHTVIYGHHMKDGSMFGELSKYKNAAYYNEHSTITLEGLEGPSKWKIFSVYVYSPEDQFFEYEFSNEEQYDAYLEKILRKSTYDTEVEVNVDDQLLTLVTCTYEITDARFIIHAKRLQ